MRHAVSVLRTRRLNYATLIYVALCLGAGPLRAACTAPVPPDASTKPEKPVLPTKGPCVDAKMGTTGCFGWEPYKYNDEVKAYNERAAAFQKAAQAYVERLNAYVKTASDYAQCEVKALQ